MNKGNIIAGVFAVVGLVVAYTFYYMGSLFTPLAGIFAGIGMIFIIGSSIIVFYSLTNEGNLWLRRKMASENIGMGIVLENGRFATFKHIELSKESVTIEEQIYKIHKEHIVYRRGSATPYILFSKGTGESVDLTTLKPTMDSELNTVWLMEEAAIARTRAFNQFLDTLKLILIIGFGALAALILIYIFVWGIPTHDLADSAVKGIANIPRPSALPSIQGVIKSV